MADFSAKQGDAAPAFTDTLTYSTGAAVDLTGASVKFVMRARSQNAPVTNAAATVTDAANGKVSYTPTTTDTAAAGLYVAYWLVTFGNGTPQRFPTIGYLTVEIQENLETPNQTIVELDDVLDYLNIPANDRTAQGELARFITGCTPVVENLTGPILPRKYQNEIYDGGTTFLTVRHRPLVSVERVVEYRGPIAYELQQIATPDQGTIYSYMWEPAGRIVRRTVGGGVTSFPSGLEPVWVSYTAGYVKIPDNVRLGALELIRVNYQRTQQGGPRIGALGAEDMIPSGPAMGYFVPGRVRELLAPSRRFPSIA